MNIRKVKHIDNDQLENEEQMYEKAFEMMSSNIANHLLNSTTISYNHHFYKALTPELKWKLVQHCHSSFIYRFRFFLGDMITKQNDCENVFLRKLLTHLKFNSFSNGQIVVEAGQQINHLFLIYSGKFEVIDSMGLFKIVDLKAGSFYGDFQILYGIRNTFMLRAGVFRRQDTNEMPEEEQFFINNDQFNGIHQCYTVDAQYLLKLFDEFPSFKSFNERRSFMRRAHWLRIQKELHFNLLEHCVSQQEKEEIVPGPLVGLKNRIASLQ